MRTLLLFIFLIINSATYSVALQPVHEEEEPAARTPFYQQADGMLSRALETGAVVLPNNNEGGGAEAVQLPVL